MKLRYLAFASIVVAFGCTAPDPNATTELPPPRDVTSFRALDGALGPSCGSLDCHGQPGRNLRIYDVTGLRLSKDDISGVGVTTDAEILATYRSFVGLEPDLTSKVLTERGAQPERLTIVRKARASEVHEGAAVWPEGSDGDRCLTSWLASKTDVAACEKARALFLPPVKQ